MLNWLFAAVRAASSQGLAKAKLFLEDMIHTGYAWRNHRLTKIMQLPPEIRGRLCTHSCSVVRPSVHWMAGLGKCCCKTLSMASQVVFRRPFN